MQRLLCFALLFGAISLPVGAIAQPGRRAPRPPPPQSAGSETEGDETRTPGADTEDTEGTEADEATEEPSVEPTEQFDPGPAPPDLSELRADYTQLMDDLVQARLRVSTLGTQLFRTRITVDLQDRTGDDVNLARFVVHLDGAPAFQSDGPVEGADRGREIYTGSLAPGPHVLTLEVEQRARQDDAYRYTLRETFRFQVVPERLSEVTLILDDDSDIAGNFPSGGEGRYEVRTRLRVATRALPPSGS